MSRSSRLTLSVVVCCYSLEREELLRRAIASLRAQARPIDQLVLVVDHNDLLLERLRATPDATVVANEGLRGLSDARNTGLRAATGDVVAFLDDDVEAGPSWSHRLMQPYRDPDVLGVGGQVVPRFESARPAWLVPEFDWVVGCTYVGHRASRGPVRNFIGANMSFRRSMFDTVQGFRTDLGRLGDDAAGCEETELCIRATRELGGAMFYEPAAIVQHYVPDERATRGYLRMRCTAEGRSKAVIAELAGRERGLASERSYVSRTLTAAVGREVVGALFARRRGSLSRIRTIVEAVVFTVFGYVRGRRALRAAVARVAANPGGRAPVALGADPHVTVIVATRDRPAALERCLDALEHLDYPWFDVVVVDNCPATPDAAAVVERVARDHPNVRYVREDVPGLGRAHNRGLEVATGSIVAFTDDDVVVDPGWLRALVDAFAGDDAIACVTGMILPAELETRTQEWIEGWAGFGKGSAPARYATSAPPDDDPLFPFAAGRFGSGANMAFRADVLRALGGFDPALGAGTPARGGDDLAIFFDLLDAGFVLAYEPAARVFHAHARDYETLRRQAYGYGVGMGAYATHVLARRPGRALRALRLVGPAARHYFGSESEKNRDRPADFPRELVWRERAGLFAGPWDYVRSRRSSA